MNVLVTKETSASLAAVAYCLAPRKASRAVVGSNPIRVVGFFTSNLLLLRAGLDGKAGVTPVSYTHLTLPTTAEV